MTRLPASCSWRTPTGWPGRWQRPCASGSAVSAALLDAAADGYAAADVVALVDAAVARDAAAVARVLPAVLAIGHTSGADLVIGIAAALRHLRPLRQLGHLCQTPTSTTHTTPIGWSAA